MLLDGNNLPDESQVFYAELTAKQQERLEYQIEVDFDRIKREFATLQTKIRLSLRDKGITPKDLATHLVGYGISESDESNLQEKESLEDIFILLSHSWSFLDCDILTSIVDAYGTEEDNRRMKEYTEKQEEFCNRRVLELPLSSTSKMGTQDPKDKEMVLKLDLSNPKLSDLKTTKKTICKILGINDPTSVSLIDVKRGCIEVRYFIPKLVSEAVFSKPLTREQCNAFRAASVLSLSCGHFKVTFQVIIYRLPSFTSSIL